jgi:hypothetical protein
MVITGLSVKTVKSLFIHHSKHKKGFGKIEEQKTNKED